MQTLNPRGVTLLNLESPPAQKSVTTKAQQQRAFYAAAQVSRLTNDWKPVNQSAMQEIRMDLLTLRARSRQLGRDNDYFRKFLTLIETNVIGSEGVQLQAAAKLANGKPDKPVNDAIEDAWELWGEMENCSANGRHSWQDWQRLAARRLIEDGEILVRKVYGRGAFGFTLHFLDPDWLDETHNEVRDGRRIIMGVELDDYDKPVAYWLTPPRNWYGVGLPVLKPDQKRIRVPASEMYHVFIGNRPGQVRGIPFAVSALLRLNMLDAYEEATLVNARVTASKMGFLVPPVGDEWSDDSEQEDLLDEVEPGILQKMPPGYTLEEFNPKDPTISFQEFSKSILRGVAAGLGLSYNTLAADLESVSFSSLRQGILEDRQFYKGLQKFLIEHLLQPIYSDWLRLSVGSDLLPIPISKLLRARNPAWKAMRWPWVDPLKDISASKLAVELAVLSRAEIIADRGGDLEEVFDALEYEQELAAEKGLVISSTQPMPEPDDDDEPAAKE